MIKHCPLLLICAFASAMGCDRKAPLDAVTPSRASGTQAVAPSTPRDSAQRDVQVASQLKDAIILDTGLSDQARRCSVSCKNGIVTITGKVPLQSDKDLIGAKANAMPAAVRVENNLEVIAQSP